jgi:hypothetical protein
MDPFSTVLFVRSLLEVSLSSSGYTVSDDWMTINNELERVWKKAVMVKVLCWHLPGATDESHEKPSEYKVRTLPLCSVNFVGLIFSWSTSVIV